MFLTKKHIHRRTFLRGAGITLGLPLLDSMVPAQTPIEKTAAKPIHRFVGIWHPHGAAPGYWSPLQPGANFEFSFITKPLEPFRDRVTLITGLDMPEAMATEDEPGGDHARGAVLLSGSRPRRNAVRPYLGVTVDQLIAQKHGSHTYHWDREIVDLILEKPKLVYTVIGNMERTLRDYHTKPQELATP